MNRKPLINIPKPKKIPKRLERKRPLKRPSPKPLTFNLPKEAQRIKRVGPRGMKKKADKRAAMDIYFKNHGEATMDGYTAICQISGVRCRREDMHPCHKVRASKGKKAGSAIWGEMPENIVAGHRDAHRWMDQGSSSERETFARSSPVNVITGGVIDWPDHLKESLNKAMQKWHNPTLTKKTNQRGSHGTDIRSTGGLEIDNASQEKETKRD